MKRLLTCSFGLGVLVSIAAVAGAAQRYVSPTGNDSANTCLSSSSPCQSIQAAVNQAATLDAVLVAEGTYHFSAGQDVCTGSIGDTAIVCILNKVLTVRGGYPTGNWSTADPVGHASIIDGQTAHRGVLVEQTGPSAPTAGLTMSGFTVSAGKVAAAASATAFGGGLLAVGPPAGIQVALQEMIFTNNAVTGGSGSTGAPGAGGGMALLNVGPGSTLDRLTFAGNTANGGTGSVRGGYGQGGGIFTFQSTVTGTYLTFTNNSALAGSTAGDGSDGATADGLGGAVAAETSSNVTLTHLLATGNLATGGNAATHAGSGLGAALYAELGTLTATFAELRGNTARGGNASGSGSTGGLAGGGGVMTSGGTLNLLQSTVIANTVIGGTGTLNSNGAGGGALYLNGNGTAQLTNDILADNLVQLGIGAGGGGGAMFLQSATATCTHVTMAHNALGPGLVGEAAVLVNSGVSLTLDYGIVANHSGGTALQVQPGATLTLNTGLFAANSANTGGGGTIGGSGFTPATSAGFHALGSPHYDYHLDLGSAAIDLASGSGTTVDIDGESRPHTADGTATGGVPDVGADEFVVPTHLFNDDFELGNVLRWSLTVP